MDGKAGRIPQKGDWIMKRLSISGFIWLAAIVIIIFLCCPSTSWGQTYGEADFSRRDCFTRDNLVACWDFLTPGVEGDLLQGLGDFETWTGAEGGCTNCPEGWNCACTPTSDINQETANIYKGNSAVSITADAANNAANAATTPAFNFSANTSYLLSFKSKGSNANDDLRIVFWCSTPSSLYYNTTSDTWQAGFVATDFTNIGTSWRNNNIYISTGASNRTGCKPQISKINASQTFYIDDVKLQKLKHPAPVSDTSIALEMPVTSDPSFDTCRDCQSFRGQPGDYGTTFSDGKSYLYRDDDNTFDPSGDFSTLIVFIPDDFSANNNLAAKWAVGQKGWRTMVSPDQSLQFLVTDDGATVKTVTSGAGTVLLNTTVSAVSSFNVFGLLSSIKLNNSAIITSVAPTGPIFNSTEGLSIGAYGSAGGEEFNGVIQKACVWNTFLSAIEANKAINPYFPGNSNGPGFYVDTCTQAASHATCSWDNCREGTPTACQAEGTGVMAVFGQFTGIQDNNSFETNTNTQDNPTFTGFTYTENAGDGTANVSQYFGESKHGNSSLRIKLTGTTSYAFVGSTCNAMLPNTDYYAYVGAKCRDGKCPTSARVYVLEYSDAGCTMNLVSNSGTMGNVVSASWADYAVQFTSAATTNFYKIGFEARNGNADVLFDALDLKEASYHTPWVHVPSGGGAVTYNNRLYSLHNPLIDESKNGIENWVGGFCAGQWVYTDWTGDIGTAHYFLNSPGNAGNNNRWWFYVDAGGNVTFYIYDSASAGRRVTFLLDSTNWSAGSWKYLEGCTDNAGGITARHYNVFNKTWYTWGSIGGVGTGIQDGADTLLQVGHYTGSATLDGYFGPFKIGPYSATWPKYYFDKQPTKKPY